MHRRPGNTGDAGPGKIDFGNNGTIRGKPAPNIGTSPNPAMHLPVHPKIELLSAEANALFERVHAGDQVAVADARGWLGSEFETHWFTITQARNALARGYGVESWERLALACDLVGAIRDDNLALLQTLIAENPRLLTESALGRPESNWGPPLSYAANIGRNRIIDWLLGAGAPDKQKAFDRACLQGQLDTARLLFNAGARPEPGAVMGPAETQNAPGLRFLLELGAPLTDADGDPLAPIALLLETYCRNPSGRRQCLEIFVEKGIKLPDTPVFALWRGRLDLLEAHVRNDPDVLSRSVSHDEIWPRALGCHADQSLALHGTPLAGATLLHFAVDHHEPELLAWMLENGADPDTPAEIDMDGFGGHTALHSTVVSQAFLAGPQKDDTMARLLLDAGAQPNPRANLRKRLRFFDDETEHTYRDVTPIGWGNAFHGRSWVNPHAMQRIEDRGGTL